MKFTLNSEETLKLKKLFEAKEKALDTANIYIDFLNNHALEINYNYIHRIIGKTNLKEERAFYFAFLAVLGLDYENKAVKDLTSFSKLDNIHCLDPHQYELNPYYQNIKGVNISESDWKMEYESIAPYQGFVYLDTIVDEDNYFKEITSLGYFAKPFNYLTIIQDNTIWMSITPHEIETMKEAIKKASDKVVVFGLGLGYFPYMISLKENVKEIVVVENDPKVIDIFQKYLLPQFQHKEKIKIVQSDAFAYAKTYFAKENFTYAFVDIWHNAFDGLELYIHMLTLEKYAPSCQFSYWIETSLLVVIRRCLITLMDEEIHGSKESDYQKERNFTDHLINFMHEELKTKTLHSYNEIKRLLQNDSLKDIVKKMKF